MEENDFLKRMENLKKPDVQAEASRRQIKLALMSAKKSAAWGVWLLIVPVFFLTCVVVKELFHWKIGIADRFIEWMAGLGKETVTEWVSPVLFVLLPALCVVANLLAIMHFVYDKATKELIVTIKLKWLNLLLALLGLAILGIVLLYGISENAAERAIHRMEKEIQNKVQ